MIHTIISAAQQTVFASNHPKIVAIMTENKGLYDERSLRKTPGLQESFSIGRGIIRRSSSLLNDMPRHVVHRSQQR